MTRRAASEAAEPFALATMLPAHVEVMLAAGELEEARRAADELTGIAAAGKRTMLEALCGAHPGRGRARATGIRRPRSSPFAQRAASGRS